MRDEAGDVRRTNLTREACLHAKSNLSRGVVPRPPKINVVSVGGAGAPRHNSASLPRRRP